MIELPEDGMQPRLSRVVLYVKDAAASARWYAERFGFTTRFERPDEGWVELDAGGGCDGHRYGGCGVSTA